MNSTQSFYEALAALTFPEPPRKFTWSYLDKIKERAREIADRNQDRIDSIARARVMPEVEGISIGSGKHFHSLAVLFLDICGFSCWDNWLEEDQAKVLRVMNIFMASMLGVIRDFNGTYEKNTGDGIMAYFFEGSTDQERVTTAVGAAMVMSYINEKVLTPLLFSEGLWPVTFRVGIDIGPVTVARVGIHSNAGQFVAIGTTANVACKLMRLVDGGGICIGEHMYRNLSDNWKRVCQPVGNTTFHYVLDKRPYPAWKINHALSEPTCTIPLGGLSERTAS